MLDQYSENSFQPVKVLCLWHRDGVLVFESHLDQQATTDIRKFSLTIGKLAVLYLVLGFAVVTNAPQTHVVDFWLLQPLVSLQSELQLLPQPIRKAVPVTCSAKHVPYDKSLSWSSSVGRDFFLRIPGVSCCLSFSRAEASRGVNPVVTFS